MMEPMTLAKKALIISTGVIYIIHLIFNALASAVAGPDNSLFPATVSNISAYFDIPITPVGATFSIWSAIFILQILWMIYAVTTIFRPTGSPCSFNILSSSFFICFILNIVMITAWLFTWARKDAVASFVIIVVGQLFFDATVGLSFRDLKKYLDDTKQQSSVENNDNVDVWINRLLVQNGLLFYGTWTTIATHLNLAIVLAYDLDVSKRTASIIALALLCTLAVTWFIVENVVLYAHAQYTFSPYIVLIIGVSGVFKNGIFDTDKVVGGLTLAILILVALLLVVRCVVIMARHMKARKEGNVSTTAEK